VEPDQTEWNVETYSDERRSPEGKSRIEPRNDGLENDLCNLDASKPRCADLRGSEKRLAASCGPPVAGLKVTAKASGRRRYHNKAIM
jgi:hypothetical protein